MKKCLVLIVVILMMNLVGVHAESNPFTISVHVENNMIIVDEYGDFTFVQFTDKIGELDKTKPVNPKDILKTLELTGYEWQYHNLNVSAVYEVTHTGLYTLLFSDVHNNVFMLKQVYVKYDPDLALKELGQVIAGTINVKNDKYLQSEQFIESDDADIKALAETLATPKDILKWVYDNISYDDEKARLNEEGKAPTLKWGAKEALTTKKGVCYDKTSLFVALCRAKGYPALNVCGAYDDAWHSWAMVFYDNRWRHCDPTLNWYDHIPSGYKLYGEYKIIL